MKKPVNNSLIMTKAPSFILINLLLKVSFSAIFIVTLLSAGYSQDEECLFRLEEAENLYNTGVFENIPIIPSHC